jgi:ribulose-phosphate 3-epimerase
VTFLHDQIEKLRSDTLIQVDGGIDASTLPVAYQAGARVFVSASAIFKHPGGITAGINSLRNSL